MGIRPNDIRILRSSEDGSPSGEASVERHERFDGDAFWTVRLGECRILIREQERGCVDRAERIAFQIPVERVSWFDPETLERVKGDE